mmetsp:Transcript_22026/g.50884  ORF Transcript_22026/g.50884 Transcript_22026/m.50884 type:complete len:189 (+) Transcript_22026:60-626(+)
MDTALVVLPGEIKMTADMNKTRARRQEPSTVASLSNLEDLELPFSDQESALQVTEHSKRKQLRPRRRASHQREKLSAFLRQYGFADVGEPKQRWCFSFEESLFPIHVAASKGDDAMVRMLLREKANPAQKTSRGRTALDIAVKFSRQGSESHQIVMDLLQGNIQVLSARKAFQLDPTPSPTVSLAFSA